MLQSLHVKNIALIDDVEIDFTDGLNILTGETGAGKSILIDAVNFALGSRMPKDVVRDVNDNALCELVFYVEDERVKKEIENLDVMLTDDQVILQRKIASGKSSCKVNGETVTSARLREISEKLIDIHGQHDHQSLLYKKNHRIMLDGFCGDGFGEKLCKLNDTYRRYKEVEKEYEAALSSKDSVETDLDYSRFVINEIESAAIKPGEDEELEGAFSRMNNSRKIAELLSGVTNALSSEGESASSLFGYALSYMKQVADLDPDASGIYEQLISAEDILDGCIRSLMSYEESLEFSPEEFEQTRQRLDVINNLKMKYGQTLEDIQKRLETENEKAERLSDHESYVNDLLSQKQELYDILCKECEEISQIRHLEGEVLQKEIEKALGNLNFLDARFAISIVSDRENITGEGFDDVEFLISTNPGEELKPLTNVASGGELSRIMLALKSVLAKRDNISTLIFDEIDTGISGKTAALVADRMSEIAGLHQVIAITHLPQIASHATSHFLISKNAEKSHTSTSVEKLSYDLSVHEIARMMAGSDITDAVIQSAKELKAAYAPDKT